VFTNVIDMNNKNISKSEAIILKILWQSSPLSAKEIADKVTNEQWSYVTIKTLINRLLQKKYLSFEKNGRKYLYKSTITKKEYTQTENKQFLERMYNGSFSGLFASFSDHEKISSEELKEIKLLIKEMEEKS